MTTMELEQTTQHRAAFNIGDIVKVTRDTSGYHTRLVGKTGQIIDSFFVPDAGLYAYDVQFTGFVDTLFEDQIWRR